MKKIICLLAVLGFAVANLSAAGYTKAENKLIAKAKVVMFDLTIRDYVRSEANEQTKFKVSTIENTDVMIYFPRVVRGVFAVGEMEADTDEGTVTMESMYEYFDEKYKGMTFIIDFKNKEFKIINGKTSKTYTFAMPQDILEGLDF